MSEAIIYLTEQELAIAGQFNGDSSEVSYDNQTFIKGANFSIRLKDQAVKYCKNVADTNLKRLIVEGQYSLTIWVQKQVLQPPKTETIESSQESEINNAATAFPNPTYTTSPPNSTNIRKYRGQVYETSQPSVSPTPQPIKQKESQPLLQKIIRKYRGQVYEEVIDTSNVESNSQKPRRKYRGQYID